MVEFADSYGRRFEYLRLSVTDQCNFRCTYCLPEGYSKPADAASPLSIVEIRRLVTAVSRLGVWKVRLTGGEPTTRSDIVELARTVAAVPGIRKVAVSTNGYSLKKLAAPLRAAGVSALNVSVDSLQPERFAAMTGTDRLAGVLSGVETALSLGYASVKLNVVMMAGVNSDELDAFLELVRQRPLSVRFIELMRTGRNAELFARRHYSGAAIKRQLLQRGWQETPRQPGDGPAQTYSRPQSLGTIGVIAPYSADFCDTCNRVRVTSQGDLRLCLFGHVDVPLRPFLQSDGQTHELMAALQAAVRAKPSAHRLSEGDHGNTWNLAAVGG